MNGLLTRLCQYVQNENSKNEESIKIMDSKEKVFGKIKWFRAWFVQIKVESNFVAFNFQSFQFNFFDSFNFLNCYLIIECK